MANTHGTKHKLSGHRERVLELRRGGMSLSNIAATLIAEKRVDTISCAAISLSLRRWEKEGAVTRKVSEKRGRPRAKESRTEMPDFGGNLVAEIEWDLENFRADIADVRTRIGDGNLSFTDQYLRLLKAKTALVADLEAMKPPTPPDPEADPANLEAAAWHRKTIETMTADVIAKAKKAKACFACAQEMTPEAIANMEKWHAQTKKT